MPIKTDVWENEGGSVSEACNSQRLAADRIALIKQIKQNVNAEFDRVAGSIREDSNKYRGLVRSETVALIAILEEKRAEFLAQEDSTYFLEDWQSSVHRMLSMVRSDDRCKAIYDARAARRHLPETGPLRYLGFDGVGGVRTYRFGRLPSYDDARTYGVNVPLTFFVEHGLSLQDGPSFCTAIMAANPQPADYWATEEDARKFLASRPVKSARKPGQRARPEIGSAR